jgi:lipoprotein-anchoring transpeptidase ErfK/SrfK
VGFALALSGGADRVERRAAPEPTTTTTAPAVFGASVVTTAVESLEVFTEPSETAEKLATLTATTAYRSPTTLLVDPTRPLGPAGWVPVTVPLQKPNGTPGWVKADQVTMSQTPYKIVIFLGKHVLELQKDGEVVLSTKVIIGAPGSVTPTGRFYLTDPLNCNKESVPGYPTGSCSGAYGAFAIGTSGLSEQLDSFQGTIPQIALHGTDLPASELGKDLSNGCIRMPNDIILQIAAITPLLGTPVTIAPF